MDHDAATIVELLRWRAREHPGRTAYIFLADGETETARLSFAEADTRARAVAAELQRHGAAGERALITYPAENGDDYVVALLGCFYAGVVAVTCDAPRGRAGAERLAWIARDAQPRFLLGPPAGPDDPASGLKLPAGLRHVHVAGVAGDAAAGWADPGLGPGALAIAQYTSGSTRSPRGVLVSHGNVMSNEWAIESLCEHDGASVFVGWLPLFHDMGLIANVLQPLYLGTASVLMPPSAFLAKPVRWLAAITRYRGVTSGGPNFAYDLCVSRVPPEQRATLDLSTWRCAFNGAEVVRAATINRFTAAFGPAGFAPETFFPCYGLAEATLIVTGAPRGVPPRTIRADQAELGRRQIAPAAPGAPGRTLVSCGKPAPGTDVVIVDPEHRTRLPSGRLGEIWVAGPGVAGGYLNQPEESARTFDARLGDGAQPFLRTGDLGALVDGELYVAGRLKDMIVIRGQNYYPHDLEWAAERAHPALRPSCGAAFAVDDGTGENLVIVYELARGHDDADIEEIASAVRRAIAAEYRIEPHTIALARSGSVPKTTSGKIRRGAARDAFRSGSLPLAGLSVRPAAGAPGGEAGDGAMPDPALLTALGAREWAAALARVLARVIAARAGAAELAEDQPLSTAGLDSLAAIEVQHIVQQRYAVELPPFTLLRDVSAVDVAADVAAAVAGRPAPADKAAGGGPSRARATAPADAPGQADGPTAGPLSAMQQALWFENELAPAGPAYTLVRALRLRGPLDLDAFRRATARVVARQPALRTRISADGGDLRQIVTDGIPLHEEHLREPGEPALTEWLAAAASRPFLRTAEPLARVTLLRLAGDDHVLVLAAHHAVADLWSLTVVIRELTALYAEETLGTPAGLPPLRTSPARHAAAELAMLGSAEGEELRAYWAARLHGAPAALELPLDRSRPAARMFRGATCPVRISAGLTARLNELSHAHRTTLFTTLITAYQVLLGRLSGQRDVIVGTLASGRDRAEVANLAGCFINLVPIRAAIDGAEPFASLLDRARTQVLSDLAHSGLPFSSLVAALAPARTPGRPPLVQALLVFQPGHGSAEDAARALTLGGPATMRCAGLEIETVPVPQPWTHHDLTVNLADAGGEVTGAFEYDAALFGQPTIAALAGRFTQLLDAVAGAPGQPVGSLPVLLPGEREAVCLAAHGPLRPRDRDGLHELVLAQAARTPDAVAVAAPGAGGSTVHLSYGGLRRQSARLAARLTAAGVRPESRVGVMLDRSADLPVALLAVLRCGACYLPLDPADPAHRLRYLIEDAASGVVITNGELAASLRALPGIEVITWPEPPGQGDAGRRGPARGTRPHPEQAAYIIYTSGSTGRPKGVVIPHRGIVNRLAWMQEAMELTAGDRVAQKTPVTFDVSVWELFWPLAYGACLVLARPGGHRDPPYLAGFLRREQVTTAHFVPSMLAEFLADPGRGTLPALRRVVCSGETLPAPLRDQFRAALGARLYNLYGPTETSVDVTWWECQPGEEGPVPIGAAIANTQVYVLGPAGELAPPQAPGEIYVGGAAVARGYLNRPGLSAAAFVPDAYGPAGARLYRTGDRARRRPDGALAYLGRTDGQVKIAGNRVELGEVEEALRGAPCVSAAAAATFDDGSGPRLAGYVVGPGADPAAVRAHLLAWLPAAMVPSAVTVLPALPLTPSGKLDRRALPPPATAPAAPVPPGTAMERRIAQIWADTLGVETVGAEDGFFALGGDSIRAIRLVGRLRAAGIPVSIADLVVAGTVRELARVAQTALANPAAHADPAIPGADGSTGPAPFSLCPPGVRARLPHGIEDAYPVSFAQRALLFNQMHHPGYEVYVTSLHLRGSCDLGALRAALRRVAGRHPYLRSSLDLASYPVPLQLVHEHIEPLLTVIDLRPEPVAAHDEIISGWLRSERTRWFDVAAGPLARFAVHLRTAGEFQLTLTSFALDGWCTATVLTEILVDYAALSRGDSPSVTAPRAGYAAFVALELEAAQSPAQQAFWAAELRGARACGLPHRTATSGSAGGPARRHVSRIDPGTATAIRRVARQIAVPLKSVLFAAHLRVVRLLSGQPDVTTGLELNGRPECTDGDRVVGVFNNIVPARVQMHGGSWADLIRAAFAAESRVLPYRRYPLGRLNQEHGAARLFGTLFVFTHFHVYEQVANLPGVRILESHAPDQTYVPLTAHFNIDAQTGGLALALDYDPGHADADLAAAIAGYYQRVLSAIAADPHAPYLAASLLAPQELHRQLTAAAGPPAPARGSPGSVHGMILAQAGRTPDAVAVAAGPCQLSYRQLVIRSGRLAAALRAAGVRPDRPVGLAVGRGIDLVVGTLGILRAGASYLPVDLDYPPERVARVLASANVQAVVARPGAAIRVPPGCPVVPPDCPVSGPPPGAPAHPAALAYVMQTSGSTGSPKSIGVPHGAVLNYLAWCAQAYRIGPGCRAFLHSPAGFDLSVTALLAPLLAGGTVDVLPTGTETLGESLAAVGGGFLKITPAHLEALGHQLQGTGSTPRLDCLVVGGEQLWRRHLAPWRELLSATTPVVNEYGPTEATVGCVAHGTTVATGEDPVPIGRPIAGVTAHVLDDGFPVPFGVPAELYVGGAGLARGYLGQPGPTAERFVPDPSGVGARLYRTGDIAWLGTDGQFRYTGRRDQQVKVRGYRVEPAEIEQELLAHPGVRNAAVVPTAGARGERRLVAYWVAADPAPPREDGDPAAPSPPVQGGPVAEHGLASWLAKRLPAHLVPAEFVQLPALPLTPGGKTDRARLPDPVSARREALLTAIEELTDDAVRELLESARAGRAEV
ncbi:MAG TPA: amino acid adenylation domain-containing protein [Streptosporangiaceae bacterium]|nr:amino acid adenylation domain-containing protein [Streptosporangiaceae bacterium]